MIHPTAVVENGAELGTGVKVGPFAYIQAGARIGDGSVIGPHACVMRHTTLGANCDVHAGAVLGDTPQDLAFKDTPSLVRIGNRCVIREGVTVHRGTKPESVTETGDECFLMANSHLAHNVRLGSGVILANGALLAGYVEVGDRAFISGNVVVHQFVRIGRLAMLGGMSGVSKDVPPFCLVRGGDTNTVTAMNIVGLRRAGIKAEERASLSKTFAMVYRSGMNVSQALEALGKLSLSGPAAEFVRFIETSKRGICRFAGTGSEEEGE